MLEYFNVQWYPQVGNAVKIARAKQFGHWFLNETTDSCISPSPLQKLLTPQNQ